MVKKYAISLDEKISGEYFDKLTNSPDYIREIINDRYKSIPRLGITTAVNEVDALGHYFHRCLREKITSKSLIKMFGTDAEKYAFEFPEYDNQKGRLNKSQSIDLQVENLAAEIAEKRKTEPDYTEARKLVDLYYETFNKK